MANSVNKVTILGALGRDPEIRTFQNGERVASLKVATSESWKDKTTGEKREKTEWHSISMFGDGLVKVAEQYLRKGSRVYIEGQLQTRKWQDQSGQDRYSTEIVIRGFNGQIVMLTPRNKDQESSGGSSSGGQSSNTKSDGWGSADPFADLDDDVPF